MPGAYSLYPETGESPTLWWTAFNSPELNLLVEQARSAGFDILTARARLAQAMAEAAKVDADLHPTLDVEGGATRGWSERMDSASFRSRTSDVKEYTVGLAAAYEIDLWGRLRAQRRAADQDVIAARQDLDAAAMTVTAEVVATWIDLVAVRRQSVILQEQIAVNRNLLDLQRLRYENGLASALDVSQQMENLAAVRAEAPILERTEQVLLNALGFLTGRAGRQGLEITQRDFPGLIPLPETGIPADLLAARPDVRAAGHRLQAADWSITAARADRLPRLDLAAAASLSSSSLDMLLSNWIASLSAALTGPLVDGGRRRAEVERARGAAEEQVAIYARIVARAVQEVEDGLMSEAAQRRYIERLSEQLRAAELAMRQARLRYLNGNSDFLNYLTGIQNVQRLQRQIVAEQAELLKFRVGVYRALGGDWTGVAVAGPIGDDPDKAAVPISHATESHQ